mgnify:FL=1
MKARILSFTLVLSALFLTGCATSVHKGQHHQLPQFTENVERPKVILMPMDISVYELGVTNTELVPEWTENARTIVRNEVSNILQNNPNLTYLGRPELTDEQVDLVDAHTSLYYPVVSAEFIHQRAEAWKHRRDKIESSIGPGLAFLREQTGADIAVFVSGDDFISSGERVATAFLAAAFYVSIPLGHSFLNVGIVDLETGDILWNNNAISGSFSLVDKEDVTSSMATIFSEFPQFGQKAVVASAE